MPWLFVHNRLADVSDVLLSMVIAYVIDELHVVVYLARAFGILGSAFWSAYYYRADPDIYCC